MSEGRTFRKWEATLEAGGAELLKRVRIEGTQNYRITYMYDGVEYSCQAGNWHGSAPHKVALNKGLRRERDHKVEEELKRKTKEVKAKVAIMMKEVDERQRLRNLNIKINAAKKRGVRPRLGGYTWEPVRELWEECKANLNRYEDAAYYLYKYTVKNKGNDVPVYVGKTDRPRVRLHKDMSEGRHKAYVAGFDVWVCKFTNRSDRDIYELYLISLWRCSLNVKDKCKVPPTIKLPLPEFEKVWSHNVSPAASYPLVLQTVMMNNLTKFQYNYWKSCAREL